MSQDLDTQHFGAPGEPGVPRTRFGRPITTRTADADVDTHASEGRRDGRIPLKHDMGPGIVLGLVRTAEKLEAMFPEFRGGVPYKAGSRIRNAAKRIQELEAENARLRRAAE